MTKLAPFSLALLIVTPAFATSYKLNVINRSDTPIQYEIFQPRCFETSQQKVTIPVSREAKESLIVDKTGACAHEQPQAKLAIAETGLTFQLHSNEHGEAVIQHDTHSKGIEIQAHGSEVTITIEKEGLATFHGGTAVSLPLLHKESPKTLEEKLTFIATYPEVTNTEPQNSEELNHAAEGFHQQFLQIQSLSSGHHSDTLQPSDAHKPLDLIAQTRSEATILLEGLKLHTEYGQLSTDPIINALIQHGNLIVHH